MLVMPHNFIDRSSENILQLAQKKQFLRFSLEPKTAVMLPIEQVTEVLKLSLNKIVPIPQMPSWTMGIYNWRGEILWTVDLGDLLGLNTWQEQQINRSYITAIIISYPNSSKAKGLEKKSIGLIVKGVEDIEWCDPNSIKPVPPSAITPVLAPFIQGHWLKPGGEMMLILDGDSIINSLN